MWTRRLSCPLPGDKKSSLSPRTPKPSGDLLGTFILTNMRITETLRKFTRQCFPQRLGAIGSRSYQPRSGNPASITNFGPAQTITPDTAPQFTTQLETASQSMSRQSAATWTQTRSVRNTSASLSTRAPVIFRTNYWSLVQVPCRQNVQAVTISAWTLGDGMIVRQYRWYNN